MIVISYWSEKTKRAVHEAIAAADLLGDQTGKHLAATLERASDRAGLHPAGLVQTLTDGASACAGQVGESQLYQEKMRARASHLPRALVHFSIRETCAIHGKVKYKVQSTKYKVQSIRYKVYYIL